MSSPSHTRNCRIDCPYMQYGKTFTYKKSTHGNRKVRAGVARRRSVLDRMDMTEEEKALRDKFSFNAERQRLLEAFHAQSFGVKSVTDAFRRASDFVGTSLLTILCSALPYCRVVWCIILYLALRSLVYSRIGFSLKDSPRQGPFPPRGRACPTGEQ